MSTEEFRVFLSFIGLMAGLSAATRIILVWLRRPRAPFVLAPELVERLDRIERAVEVTALEVERIGEGQRFLTRALGERGVAEAHRPDASGRVITPH